MGGMAEIPSAPTASAGLASSMASAKLAEARLREEEAKLMLAKLAAERAQIEATMQPTENEAADKKKGGLKGLFGGRKR